jgi:D-alanyl-D-alanine carboxypeptidase
MLVPGMTSTSFAQWVPRVGARLLVVAILAASCASTSTASPQDDLVGRAEPTVVPSSAPTSGAATTVLPSSTSDVPASSSTAGTEAPETVASITDPGGQLDGRLRTQTPFPAIPRLTGWPAFDQTLLTVLDNGSTAVSVTVLRNGVVEHEVAIGSRTVAGDDPVDVGDRYRVASISKVITAVTMLRLVDAGIVGLDDPIGDRLINRLGIGVPAESVAAITVRNLLTHRSGIGQYEDLVFRNEVGSCPEAAAVALTRPLEGAPATTFRYSNVNFCLLGLAIEEVTGRPYVDVVSEQLLTPLGIEGMRLASTFDDGADLPVEHRSDAGRNYMEVLGAAGAWIASPTEIATILNSLDAATPGWKPLTESTLDAMMTITVDPPPPLVPPSSDPTDQVESTPPSSAPPALPPDRGYGMGLMIFGPDTFGHTGTVESTHAMMVRRPDGITWVVTVSGDFPDSTRQLATIVDNALRYAGFSGT